MRLLAPQGNSALPVDVEPWHPLKCRVDTLAFLPEVDVAKPRPEPTSPPTVTLFQTVAKGSGYPTGEAVYFICDAASVLQVSSSRVSQLIKADLLKVAAWHGKSPLLSAESVEAYKESDRRPGRRPQPAPASRSRPAAPRR